MHNKRAGYTFFELITVIGVTIIFGSVALLNLPTGLRTKNEIDNAIGNLRSHIALVQQRSITQENGVQWGIHIDTSTPGNHFYQIFYGDTYETGTVVETIHLPNGIIFLSPSTGNTEDIMFDKVSGWTENGHSIVIGLESIGENPQLDSANQELQTNLNLVRENAIDQVNDANWGIRADATNPGIYSYDIFYIGPGGGEVIADTITLPDGTIFVSPDDGQTGEIIYEKGTGDVVVGDSIIIGSDDYDDTNAGNLVIAPGTGIAERLASVPPFDASMSLSPSSATVQAGASTLVAVTANVISGIPGSAVFSASNLPTGVTFNFSPVSCTPTCATDMTIQTGLDTPDGSHQITISITAGGLSRSTTFSLFVNSQSAPDAPVNLAATSGDAEIDLAWQEPAFNGGATVTSYKIYRSATSGGALSHVGTVGQGIIGYTNTGLANGATYYYKVSAVNAAGEGDLSNEGSATTYSLPGAPLNPSASAGSGEVVLNWQAPVSDGGSVVSEYRIYRSATSGGALTQVGSTNGATLTYTNTGLSDGSTYYYKVSAVNVVGEGSLSSEVSAIIGAKKIFITSTVYDGNLGGFSGADSKCSVRASAAGLSGIWKSWLSDGSVNASDRLYQSSSPYVNMAGTKVADNWTDLTDGSLDSAIRYDEFGVSKSGQAWTGSYQSGLKYFSQDCSNWTSSSGSGGDAGSAGFVTATDYQWSFFGTNSCGTSLPLYCIEQEAPASIAYNFDYTGSEQSFIVPSGVTSLTVDAVGASGPSSNGGGRGGRTQGSIAVTPGETIYIYVGGTGGWNGGGYSEFGNGGGATDIRRGGTALANRVIVAAGGGGGADSYGTGNPFTADGGDGGGLVGEDGETNAQYNPGGDGGGGGTQSAGGAGGVDPIGDYPGFPGSLGQGGSADINYGATGGGGGGYYGGGGGADRGGGYRGGGGGGGSAFIPSGGSTTAGYNTPNADGYLIISWEVYAGNATFNTVGEYSFTVPQNVISLTVDVRGSGGGGGGGGGDCGAGDGGGGSGWVGHHWSGSGQGQWAPAISASDSSIKRSGVSVVQAATGGGGGGGEDNQCVDVGGAGGLKGSDVYNGLSLTLSGGASGGALGSGTSGGANGSDGGAGDKVTGTISVTPGEILTVIVGQPGQGGGGVGSSGGDGSVGSVTITW